MALNVPNNKNIDNRKPSPFNRRGLLARLFLIFSVCQYCKSCQCRCQNDIDGDKIVNKVSNWGVIRRTVLNNVLL